MRPDRREHIARVAALMDRWADALELPADERLRWRAAAWLHDSLRDADPAALRSLLPDSLRDLPPPLLHGPAAAARLREEGVDDEGLLGAVAYHTLGHRDLAPVGRFLYLADFLEPGRTFEPVLRAVLRARMPVEAEDVLPRVVALRIRHMVDAGRRIRPETVAFWNGLVPGR